MKKAQVDAIHKAVRLVSAIYLTVLVDKFGMAEKVPELYKEANKLSESIKEGYVSVSDLVNVLWEEYGIEL